MAHTQELLEACEAALEDILIWHDESFAFTSQQGHIEYDKCSGCDTCKRTIPMLRAAIAKARTRGESNDL